MLTVHTPQQVLELISQAFSPLNRPPERVSLESALGRVLAVRVRAEEYVPDFHRSTVDGYALRCADTFGCAEAFPALLRQVGSVEMGQAPAFSLGPGECAAIPTGGALPQGADGVQMLEYAEDYGDGTVGILRSAAPGENLIFRGDDVKPGDVLLEPGRRLEPQDIGALAALGCTQVEVLPRLRVGVLSTGDELVPPHCRPGPGQVRDVNSALTAALLTRAGAQVRCLGVVPDRAELLRSAVENALSGCDVVVLSGGSSVGEKDAAARVLEALGTVLVHGVAMKPGKPTLLARVGDKPVVGLPGHPVAALFCTHLFVCPLLARLEGRTLLRRTVEATLTEAVSANHGRAQYTAVTLHHGPRGLLARPIRTKSGLITTLAGADGYFCIPRDCEGFPQGQPVAVTLFALP